MANKDDSELETTEQVKGPLIPSLVFECFLTIPTVRRWKQKALQVGRGTRFEIRIDYPAQKECPEYPTCPLGSHAARWEPG